MASVGPNVGPSAQPSAQVSVAETVQPIVAHEFAHFLYLFRAAYARCVDLPMTPETAIDNPDAVAHWFASTFKPNTAPLRVANLFNTDLEDDELEISKLSKSSPLEMVIGGCMIALVAAVIVSGGTAQLLPPKFTLPPLGSGIKHLREAFRLPKNKPLKRKLKKRKSK